MPAKGRATRASQRAAKDTALETKSEDPVVAPQTQPKATRSTRSKKTAVVEEEEIPPVDVAPPVEAEATTKPTQRRTRGRANSKAAAEPEQPVESEIKKETKPKRGAKATKAAEEAETLAVATAPKRSRRTRKGSVTEKQDEPIPAEAEQLAELPVVDTAPVNPTGIEDATIEEEKPAGRKSARKPAVSRSRARGKKNTEAPEEAPTPAPEAETATSITLEEEPVPATIADVVEDRPAAEQPAPSLRSTRGRAKKQPPPEQVITATEPVIAAPEPQPQAVESVQPKRPTRGRGKKQVEEEVTQESRVLPTEEAPKPKRSTRGKKVEADVVPLTTQKRGKRVIEEVLSEDKPAPKRSKRARRGQPSLEPEIVQEEEIANAEPAGTDANNDETVEVIEEKLETKPEASVADIVDQVVITDTAEIGIDDDKVNEEPRSLPTEDEAVSEAVNEIETTPATEVVLEDEQDEQTDLATKEDVKQIVEEIVEVEVTVEQKIEQTLSGDVESDNLVETTTVETVIMESVTESTVVRVADEEDVEPQIAKEDITMEDAEPLEEEAQATYISNEQVDKVLIETKEESIDETVTEVIEKVTTQIVVGSVEDSTEQSVEQLVEDPAQVLTEEEITGDIEQTIEKDTDPESAEIAKISKDSLTESALNDITNNAETRLASPAKSQVSADGVENFDFSNPIFGVYGEIDPRLLQSLAFEQQSTTIQSPIQNTFLTQEQIAEVELLDDQPPYLMEAHSPLSGEMAPSENTLDISFGISTPLGPMSPAAINAGQPNEPETHDETTEKQPVSNMEPPQTPSSIAAMPFGLPNMSPWYMRHRPNVSSPLKRPPLTYSPSVESRSEDTPQTTPKVTPQPTPQPTPVLSNKRIRVDENGITSANGDPSPLRADELNPMDFTTPVTTPTNKYDRSPRKIATPGSKKGRPRGRTVRRESSPLKNSIQAADVETEQTPREKKASNALSRFAYDPNQDISELREEEVPLTPAPGTPAQNILGDISFNGASTPNKTAAEKVATPKRTTRGSPKSPFLSSSTKKGTEKISSPAPVVSPQIATEQVSSPIRASVENTPEARQDSQPADEPSTPTRSNDVSDIPFSSPMATPMPVRVSRTESPQKSPTKQADSVEVIPETPPKAQTAVSEKTEVRRSRRFEPKKDRPEVRHSTGSVSVVKDLAEDTSSRRVTLSGAIDSTNSSGDIKHPRADETRCTYLETPEEDGQSSPITPDEEIEMILPKDIAREMMDAPVATSPIKSSPVKREALSEKTASPLANKKAQDEKVDESNALKASRKSRIPLPRSGGESGHDGESVSARLNRVTQTKNLTDRELSKLTARNTSRNSVYKHVNFERKVVRMEGHRPPSPKRETQSAAAQQSRNDRKRLFDETGIALGPGDDIGYSPPEDSPSVKRVKWHSELEHEHDDSERRRFQTEKGILAPERVRRESGNIHHVTIQKFLYDGEKDFTEE